MAKMMCAKDILKEKGYVAPKFDTAGFMQAVGEYFMSNPVESKLLLVPYRFVDIEWDDILGDGELSCYDSPYDFDYSDMQKGYRAETETDICWGIKEARSYDEDNRMRQQEAGILVPRIIIDKPFFENAAQMLKVMGGYVLERKMKKRVKMYYVSLV